MAVINCSTDICEYLACLFIEFHTISIKALKYLLNHYVLRKLTSDSAAAQCLTQGTIEEKCQTAMHRCHNFVMVSDLLCAGEVFRTVHQCVGRGETGLSQVTEQAIPASVRPCLSFSMKI